MNQKEEIEKLAQKFANEFDHDDIDNPFDLMKESWKAGYAAATPAGPETVGQILKKAFDLHELNPIVVGETLDFPKGIITDLINDNFYTNSVPVVLFKNLLMSLHIPFSKIEPAMIPTFKLVLSKETPATIRKKPHGYGLWENEESVHKYTHHLKEIMPSAPSPSIEAGLREYTITDFFDSIRGVMTEARDWWHRRKSIRENDQLLAKYYPQEKGVPSDEMIINMFMKEEKNIPKEE